MDEQKNTAPVKDCGLDQGGQMNETEVRFVLAKILWVFRELPHSLNRIRQRDPITFWLTMASFAVNTTAIILMIIFHH